MFLTALVIIIINKITRGFRRARFVRLFVRVFRRYTVERGQRQRLADFVHGFHSEVVVVSFDQMIDPIRTLLKKEKKNENANYNINFHFAMSRRRWRCVCLPHRRAGRIADRNPSQRVGVHFFNDVMRHFRSTVVFRRVPPQHARTLRHVGRM